MQKNFIVSLVAVMTLVSFAPALTLAREDSDNRRQDKKELVQIKNELKAEIKLEKKDLKERIKELARALKFAPRALTITGTLVAVSSTTTSSTEITVDITKVTPVRSKKIVSSTLSYPEKGTRIVLRIDEKTTLVRAYGGKMKLSEMTLGDKLHIVAKFKQDGTLDVRIVKDNSLHVLRHKKGTVESVNTSNSSFVLKQEERALTVNTNSQTKFYMKGSATAPTFASLQVGDKVSVGGILNVDLKTVAASSITILKRPVVTPPTATSTPPSPTTTPTPTTTPSST